MTPVQDARSVSSAARALARALDGRGTDVRTALDTLELHARRVVEDAERGFADDAAFSEESLLQEALVQLEVGATLCAAEQAQAGRTGELTSAAAQLDQAADAIDTLDGSVSELRGFDAATFTGNAGDAALLALDEMAAAAGEVAAKVLGDTFKPLLDKVPQELRDLLGGLAEPAGLLRWAMRAVRKGIDLLTRLVDLPVLETAGQRVDEVLERLGKGEDGTVIAGSVIGADAVRARLREIGPVADSGTLVQELADVAERYGRLCTLLGRVAVAVTGLSAVLAVLQITLAHAAAITTAGLAVVLCVLVVLGRDHTGASDVPGGVRGIRVLIEDRPRAAT